MRAPHLLVFLLVLLAIGSSIYVDLYWNYRDAPENIKTALLLGGVGMLGLALLGFPLLAKRGR